jgi:di/tricarboxylate transporter
MTGEEHLKAIPRAHRLYAGYVPLGQWMRHGFVVLMIHLVIFLGLGTAWMKVVGLF